MARPVHARLLRPLLHLAVICLLLLQVSESSRPPSPSPADRLDDDALHHHQQQLLLLDAEARTARPPTSTEVVAGDGRTGAAAAPSSASATSTPARAVPAVVASPRPRQTSDRAALPVRAGRTPPEVLLRSKLARRFLAGAGGVHEAASSTDGAAPSCRSNSPHINCGPPPSKP